MNKSSKTPKKPTLWVKGPRPAARNKPQENRRNRAAPSSLKSAINNEKGGREHFKKEMLTTSKNSEPLSRRRHLFKGHVHGLLLTVAHELHLCRIPLRVLANGCGQGLGIAHYAVPDTHNHVTGL